MELTNDDQYDTIKKNETKEEMMKKRDLLWTLVLAFLFTASSMIWWLWGNEKGTWAVIVRDGKLLYRVPLAVTRDIEVTGDWGRNTIRISSQGIEVIETDCPDKLCQKQGLVQKAGVPIVCLPHKLTVEIEGGGDEY